MMEFYIGFGIGVVGIILGSIVGSVLYSIHREYSNRLKAIEENMLKFEAFKRNIESIADDGR